MADSIRMRFCVGEPGRFISHLDVLRMVERSVRRAGLPIEYSEGFNPIPKMAFASALPVGITSEAEYVDLKMKTAVESGEATAALNSVLPQGFQILEAVNLPERSEALMSIITTAQYQIKLLQAVPELETRITEILDQKEISILVKRKNKTREKNIRELIDRLTYDDAANSIFLQCACGLKQNLRPMDLLPFLGLSIGDVLIHRTALLVKTAEGALLTPFEAVKGKWQMLRKVVISSFLNHVLVGIVENGRLAEFFQERDETSRTVGNIYKGRIENVLPGMGAAFVELGLERNGFLYVADLKHETIERPINELVKKGQEIIVQVSKEPEGTKGARVVTQISLPGRFLVLMPDEDSLGVSRQITDPDERARLRKLGAELKLPGYGLILRTAAAGHSFEELAGSRRADPAVA